ncbi:9468_t:CDS:2 [Gigaspora margarita]|uniref:9468_t:CDS:1 n=1 Tax=Gigaspora margarita TaxID=4874 RepID=A0ABN7UJA1_GIGMA|nr:9468_t:CDS:2 [Gigaspora margarita]
MVTIICKECHQDIDKTKSWCTSCNARHFVADFPNWTSESAEMDKFIQETQKLAERYETVLEWIDYTKFTKLEPIEFSKNYKAYWEEGHILGWDLESNKWKRHGGHWVKLITNYCEKYITSFLKSEHEFSKTNPLKRLVYGITRDPKTKDYAVVEKLTDQCPKCPREWMSIRWCSGCYADHFKAEFPNWTSGNEDIDKFILETQTTAEFPEQALEWIPETHLTEFEMIGRGGFGSIFKAYWEKGHIQKWCFSANEWKRSEPLWVALKSVDKDDENNEHKAFLEEAKNLHECLKINLYSLDFYGITKHPTTQKYLIVMRYAEEGDLRKYLRNNFKTFDWKNRIDKLWGLATDIRSMHEKGLVHRDLHPGNVLFGEAELIRPKNPRLFTLNPGAIFSSSPIPKIKYWSFNKK